MPVERIATCRCRQLRAVCTGDPVRVSVCHCLECQRRSGSAFAVQARFAAECVVVTGATRDWTSFGEGGAGTTFRFCPRCGTTIAYVSGTMPGLVAVPVGTFADPAFPPPSVSGYEERRHPWVAMHGEDIAHFD